MSPGLMSRYWDHSILGSCGAVSLTQVVDHKILEWQRRTHAPSFGMMCLTESKTPHFQHPQDSQDQTFSLPPLYPRFINTIQFCAEQTKMAVLFGSALLSTSTCVYFIVFTRGAFHAVRVVCVRLVFFICTPPCLHWATLGYN